MSCLFYVIPVGHTCVSPPFHNETDPRHLDYVSDLEQCVYKVCMHLRRFSDILNLRGGAGIRNVSPRGYDMP